MTDYSKLVFFDNDHRETLLWSQFDGYNLIIMRVSCSQVPAEKLNKCNFAIFTEN